MCLEIRVCDSNVEVLETTLGRLVISADLLLLCRFYNLMKTESIVWHHFLFHMRLKNIQIQFDIVDTVPKKHVLAPLSL